MTKLQLVGVGIEKVVLGSKAVRADNPTKSTCRCAGLECGADTVDSQRQVNVGKLCTTY